MKPSKRARRKAIACKRLLWLTPAEAKLPGWWKPPVEKNQDRVQEIGKANEHQ